jgi:signal transduction histidine kinase
VTTSFAPELPTVIVDAERITQVVFNLLSNAVRYTPIHGQIEISGRLENDFVQVSVKDSGPGLQAEEIPHIFDRFYRGDKGRDRRMGGAGLGLAIAKSLVEAHGGQIGAYNRSQGGSCFYFTIPVKQRVHNSSSLWPRFIIP